MALLIKKGSAKIIMVKGTVDGNKKWFGTEMKVNASTKSFLGLF